MSKTYSAKELLERIERAEMREFSEDVRDEAQALLLSRHLALLAALRKTAKRDAARGRRA